MKKETNFNSSLKPNVQSRNLVSKITDFPSAYVIFIFGLLISRIGDSLYTFALPWIAYKLTGSAIIMSSLFAIGVLPIVLFGPIVGVVVDRFDRRKLMWVADVGCIILVSLIPLLYNLSVLQLWHLYVVSFILAVLSMLFDVATITVIPQIAGPSLTRANSAYQMVNQIASLAGPALAGIIIAIIGGINALWINALSFIATLVAVLLLPKLEKKKPTDRAKTLLQTIKNDMREGLKWLINDRLNLALSLQAMVGNFGASAVLGGLMYYLLSTLNLSAEESGINYTLIGVGGLLGSIIVIPLEQRFRRGILIPTLLAVGAIGLTYAIWSEYWLAPGISFGLAMICNIAWNTIVASVRQETVPTDMQGRVLGFSRVLTRLAMPLGALVGGLISDFNPVAIFILASTAKFIEVIIALTSPIRKL
ncbi:MFS transporter [Bacillus nitratireducens]|uniref:MFS transporter n=1 Tax=Bacillus nitratireducens TaxID=2026193 RepID=UPI000BF622D1|nr:MFS transporter [Bacillus nitratireducens]PFH93602.1 MFS transporter [Bacillus cereus]MED0906620.1 MFS transporter [Bacillus nitratireducens]PFM50326.1 MFS transporter [Bacillus cereus]PGS22171.1 MFS transporter [Bacillus cereus]PGW30409.1 MFS transporter [Bacillus cereus]